MAGAARPPHRRSKRSACAWAVIAWGLVSPAAAQPLAFFGEVGGAPVLVVLDQESGKLSGDYLYARRARSIRLEGVMSADGAFTLDEFDFSDGARTGRFQGRSADGEWSGTWSGADGRRLDFVLHPASTGLSGKFACQARFSASGYRYRERFDLDAARGRVKAFSLSQTVTGWGDTQQCSMDLGDVGQVPSPSGLVLKAGQDPDSGEAPVCAVSIVGGGAYLLLRVGDCRSADGAMLCSARGSWSDLVIDRAAQSCRAVQ